MKKGVKKKSNSVKKSDSNNKTLIWGIVILIVLIGALFYVYNSKPLFAPAAPEFPEGFKPTMGYWMPWYGNGRLMLWDAQGDVIGCTNPEEEGGCDVFDSAYKINEWGIPGDFKAVAGLYHPVEGGYMRIWNSSGHSYSWNGQQGEKYVLLTDESKVGSGLPVDYKPIVAYYHDLADQNCPEGNVCGYVHLWDANGVQYSINYNPNAGEFYKKYVKVEESSKIGSGLPANFKPIVGYTHPWGNNGGRYALFDAQGRAYVWNPGQSRYVEFTEQDKQAWGLPPNFKPVAGYYHPFGIAPNNGRIMLWDNLGNGYGLTGPNDQTFDLLIEASGDETGPICSDSDDGNIFTESGNINVTDNGIQQLNVADVCLRDLNSTEIDELVDMNILNSSEASMNNTDFNKTLIEAICPSNFDATNETMFKEAHVCENECSDAACVVEDDGGEECSVNADCPLGYSCDSDGDCVRDPVCEAGEEDCNGRYLQRCVNGQWSNVGLVPGECNYQVDDTGGSDTDGTSDDSTLDNAWIYVIIIIVVLIIIVVAIIIFVVIKRKNEEENISSSSSTQKRPSGNNNLPSFR